MARLLTVAELDLVSGGEEEIEEIVVVGRRRQRDNFSLMEYQDLLLRLEIQRLAALNSAADEITPPDEDTGEADLELTPEELAAAHGINVKTGVNAADISNLTDEMTDTFDDIVDAWENNTDNVTPTITSGRDGDEHGKETGDTLHYEGNALDLRTRDLSETETSAVATALRTSLGSDYDVLVKTEIGNLHIHIEYQPK